MPKLREEFLDDHRKGTVSEPVIQPDVGRKYDGGKAPVYQGFEAYFPLAILAVANVSKYGAEKYSVRYEDKDWRKVENGYARYKDGESRHKLLPNTDDGLYDHESHLLHAAHEAWNAMATLQMLLEQVPLRDPVAP